MAQGVRLAGNTHRDETTAAHGESAAVVPRKPRSLRIARAHVNVGAIFIASDFPSDRTAYVLQPAPHHIL